MQSQPPLNSRVIPIAIGRVWKDEFGFCRIRLEADTDKQMGVPEVIEMGIAAYEICGGEKHKHLIDARGVYGAVLPGAREEIRSNGKLNACRSAAAMITNSMANKLIISFFIQFNKPPYPYRVFENPEEAVTWLNSL